MRLRTLGRPDTPEPRTPVSARPESWPHIHAHELDDFFRDLRAGVVALEDAYARRELASALEDASVCAPLGPRLVQAYRALLDERPLDDPEHRRRTTVHALLDQTKAEIFHIEHWWNAELVEERDGAWQRATPLPAEPEADGPPALPFDGRHRVRIAEGVAEPVLLRLDQVVAARFWGIGFVFDDPDVTDELANRLAFQTARHLERDLLDLRRLLRRILRAETGRFPSLIPEREARAFEQLMLDVLNEHTACARQAPLIEDYSQKTDLRVRYPWLDRRRGARVQVTAIADPERHLDKLADIRRVGQFVILSPLTLARFVDTEVHDGAHEHLAPDVLGAFWEQLPGRPMDVGALAQMLRRMLFDALPRRDDPRGPVAALPPAVRAVLRAFVAHEARRSTEELRAWEARHGPYRGGADGRLRERGPRRLPESARKDWAALSAALTPGTRVVTRTTSCSPRGVHVVLPEHADAPGWVPRDELAWDRFAPGGADPEVDEQREAVVAAIDADLGLVNLSFRRAQADPWQTAGVADWAPGTIVQGTVRNPAHYGVFVELAPGVVGLVHVSNLTQPPESHSAGSSLPVQVERVDLERRRIALRPADPNA